MVVCADEAVARTVRLLRNQGMERRYANEIVGYNMRMTDLHAAIGRVQLDALPDRTEQRRRNAAFLGSELAGTGVVVPPTAPGAAPVWHQYTVRAPIANGCAAGWPTGGWARACTTPRRSTGSRRTRSSSTCP